MNHLACGTPQRVEELSNGGYTPEHGLAKLHGSETALAVRSP